MDYIKYYLPSNWNELMDSNMDHDLLWGKEIEAEKAFKRDYKNLAWQKANQKFKANAKAFIKKYVKSGNAEEAKKDFVWDSLDEEKQEAIKDEVIVPLKKKREEEIKHEKWIDEFAEEMINEDKIDLFREKVKKNKAKRQINKLLKKYVKQSKAKKLIKKSLKKYVNKKKEEWTKKGNLKSLIKTGYDIKAFLEHGEDKRESFFPFEEPVPGCKYDIGQANGYVIIPMKQTDLNDFLSDIEIYTYDVLKQLYDNINKALNVDVTAICMMQKESQEGIIVEQRTDHSGWQNLISRNGLQSICELIKSKIGTKLSVPKQKSGFSFRQGVLIKITYRSDYTKTKKKNNTKNKGGSWIELSKIPCISNRVEDKKKMYNFSSKNKDSYIFNFMNSDNLCFLYNIIIVKFLCSTRKDEKRDTHKLLPTIEPYNTDAVIPYLPLINYPNKALNEEAERIRNNSSISEILQNIGDKKVSFTYIAASKEFAQKLNNSKMFPLNADDAALLK